MHHDPKHARFVQGWDLCHERTTPLNTLCHRRKNRQPPVSIHVFGLAERVYPRPSDNDRYVPRAPENPKKVSVFLVVSL